MKSVRYIRFGDIPESGRSMNNATHVPEDGVSAYRLIRVGRKWMIDQAYGSYMCLRNSNRPCYEIAGDVEGFGSDGEPLLKNPRIIRRIKDAGWDSAWEKVNIPGLSPTESVYRHMLSGTIWCSLSNAPSFHGVEFRADPENLEAELSGLYDREKAASIVNYMAPK